MQGHQERILCRVCFFSRCLDFAHGDPTAWSACSALMRGVPGLVSRWSNMPDTGRVPEFCPEYIELASCPADVNTNLSAASKAESDPAFLESQARMCAHACEVASRWSGRDKHALAHARSAQLAVFLDEAGARATAASCYYSALRAKEGGDRAAVVSWCDVGLRAASPEFSNRLRVLKANAADWIAIFGVRGGCTSCDPAHDGICFNGNDCPSSCHPETTSAE